jgi:hypothetical protein
MIFLKMGNPSYRGNPPQFLEPVANSQNPFARQSKAIGTASREGLTSYPGNNNLKGDSKKYYNLE